MGSPRWTLVELAYGLTGPFGASRRKKRDEKLAAARSREINAIIEIEKSKGPRIVYAFSWCFGSGSLQRLVFHLRYCAGLLSDDDRRTALGHIHCGIFQALGATLDHFANQGLNFENEDLGSLAKFLEEPCQSPWSSSLTPALATKIEGLKADSRFEEALVQRYRLGSGHLLDPLSRRQPRNFFDDVRRFSSLDSLPTSEELLQATYGCGPPFCDLAFSDVCGGVEELCLHIITPYLWRPPILGKRMLSFENDITCFITVIDLSQYDTNFVKDPQAPHAEAIPDMFRMYLEMDHYRMHPCILLLDRYDVFKAKLSDHTVKPFHEIFPEYSGGDDEQSITDFICSLFVADIKEPQIYLRLVNTIDMSLLDFIIASVRNILQREKPISHEQSATASDQSEAKDAV